MSITNKVIPHEIYCHSLEDFGKQHHFFTMAPSKAAKKTKFIRKHLRKQTDRLLQRAITLHQEGKLTEAQNTYEKILSINPRNSDVLGNLGLLKHSQGSTSRAVELYQQALSLSPNQDHLYYFLGNGLKELGQNEKAVAAYQKALAANYDSLNTLLHLGMSRQNLGQLSQARECYEQILRLSPKSTQAAYHLGLLAFQQGRYKEAADHFSTVLQYEAENIDASFNLALCHKELGQRNTALELLKKAGKLAPEDSDISYNIGVLYKEEGEFNDAEEAFLHALTLSPDKGICLTDLAILYHMQNRLEEAVCFYKRALEVGYHSEAATHMIAALNGQKTDSAPHQYILDIFDNYASDFELILTRDLNYDIPRQLAHIFQEYHDKPLHTALDLGCGTGLSGLPFRETTTHLTGVDLSQKMLAVAEKKQIYDQLHCRELIDFLQSTTDDYQLVIAADVFVYLGRLEPFFTALNTSLSHGSYVLFSVERCSGESYCLRQSGRYAHSEKYIGNLAETFDFRIKHQQEAGIRKERGAWIPGDIYLLQRG
ncbi:MAG: tetratricopeptide repeat protein [Desulfobulbaceae bacterium]|nr:tetratricopeptide repeat protein [Desulfobulbaceae bacterium]